MFLLLSLFLIFVYLPFPTFVYVKQRQKRVSEPQIYISIIYICGLSNAHYYILATDFSSILCLRSSSTFSLLT